MFSKRQRCILAGFVYTTIISTACYVVKSTDGISASVESTNELLDTQNKTPVTQATTMYISRIDGPNKGLKYYIEHHVETKVVNAKEEIDENIGDIIEDDVFWSTKLERLLPKG